MHVQKAPSMHMHAAAYASVPLPQSHNHSHHRANDDSVWLPPPPPPPDEPSQHCQAHDVYVAPGRPHIMAGGRGALERILGCDGDTDGWRGRLSG
jgi:hypothetical protein